MSSRNRTKYTRLRETVEFQDPISRKRAQKKPSKDDYYDDQFDDVTPIKTPKKSIALAIFLFALGTVLLVLGSLMVGGVIGAGVIGDKGAPLLVVGAICFLPGAYNVRTAYYSWKGYKGFSYADMAGYSDD